MTQIDEPNLDELDELQKECNINEYGDIDVNGHYIFKRFREILADQVAKARINELERYFEYWRNSKDTRGMDTYKADRIAELSNKENK